MHQHRRARILLAVLVLAALLLVTLDYRSRGGAGEGPLGRLRGLASAVLAPIQSGLATIFAPVGSAVASVDDLLDVRAENQQLRAQLDRLERQRLSYEDLLRENAELRALLGLAERRDFSTVTAQVIAQGPSNFEWTVTLDVGTGDGVERDMAVINDRGLVGRVIQATTSTARVLLAVDPTFQAASRHAASGETGVVQGNGGAPMLFRPFDPDVEVEVGDVVVTSSYSNGVFPAGIEIGTVASPGDPADELTRTVEVRPLVDFTRLSTVLVVREHAEPDLPGERLPPGLDFVPPDVTPSTPPAREQGGP